MKQCLGIVLGVSAVVAALSFILAVANAAANPPRYDAATFHLVLAVIAGVTALAAFDYLRDEEP